MLLCALESLLQPDVPKPALDRGDRLVVAVLERAGHKRWICVEHVLHPKRDRGVIEPPLPVAAAVLSRGYWDDILLLAILAALHVFAAVLGKARHLCWSGWRQVERVIQDQIERNPVADVPRAPTVQASIRTWHVNGDP